MGGGVILGTIWGAVISVVVLAVVSLSTPLPPRPDAIPDVMDAASAEIATPPAESAVPSDPVPLPAGSAFNRVPPEEATTPPEADSPVRGDPADTADTAGDGARDADRPEATGRFTSAPAPEDSIATPPAALAPGPDLSVGLPQITRDDGAERVASAPAPLDAQPVDPPANPDRSLPPPPPAPEAEPAPQPEPEPQPEPAPASEPVDTAALPEDATPDTALDAPEDPAPEDTTGPRPLVPFGAVTVEAETALAPDTAPEAETARSSALVDNAAPFDPAETRPLLSVILIDTPEAGMSLDLLTGITVPVAFAVDATRPDAAERAAAFRAAGHEVVIYGDILPGDAPPEAVAPALAAATATLPQAVALLDTATNRIQGDRPLLDATVAALSQTGHGLLAFPSGLNAAEQTASRSGLPAATLFRLLDDEDQSAPVITRFLRRAEFAAAEEGTAVVAGRTRPDTVTALLSWALSSRSEAVALAPLSATLLRAAEEVAP